MINKLISFKHFPTITGLGRVFYPIWKRSTLKFFIIFLYKIALKNVKIVSFQNNDDQSYFQNLGLTQRKNSKVINGSGVDTKIFKFDSEGYKKTNFLMIGRLLNQKGIKLFLKNAEKIKKKYPKYTFTLIGKKEEGPDKISFNEIKYYIDNKIINYISETNDVIKFYNECKVFILPSYYREGMPKTMIEAMSIGRPVIVSDIPGPKDIIENKIHGILLDLNDLNSLEKAIKYFINISEIDYKRISKNCRSTAESYFDISIINAIYKSYLNS